MCVAAPVTADGQFFIDCSFLPVMSSVAVCLAIAATAPRQKRQRRDFVSRRRWRNSFARSIEAPLCFGWHVDCEAPHRES